MTPSNNWILTIKPYQVGERKAKTNTKTMLVNKANRPHMLIKDRMGTLISGLIYSKCQATPGHQPISFTRCRIQRRQREINWSPWGIRRRWTWHERIVLQCLSLEYLKCWHVTQTQAEHVFLRIAFSRNYHSSSWTKIWSEKVSLEWVVDIDQFQ